MQAQRGFTLLQVLVAMSLGATIAVASLRGLQGSQIQGEFEQAIAAGERVAAVADALQNRVVASAVDPTDGTYSYTYAGARANWTAAQELIDEHDANVPAQTIYGTNYEFRANGFPAQVRFVVPADIAPRVTAPGRVTTTSLASGAIRVSFQRVRPPEKRISHRLRGSKAGLYLEELR